MDNKDYPMDKSLFAARLEEAIAKTGIKKAALAKAVGLTPQSLSRYLSSGRMPHISIVALLAQKLHVSADYLRGTSPEPAPLADTPVVREATFPYPPDAVSLVGLNVEERRTVLRMLEALRSGDDEIRRHLIGQLKIIETAVQSRRQQPRAEREGA